MLAFEVPFTSTAGNVGCFFWSHDIGGHNGGRNEEVLHALGAVRRDQPGPALALDARRPDGSPPLDLSEVGGGLHARSRSTCATCCSPISIPAPGRPPQNTVPLDRPLYIDYPRPKKPITIRRNICWATIFWPRPSPCRASARAASGGRLSGSRSGDMVQLLHGRAVCGRHRGAGFRRHQRVSAVCPGRRSRPHAALSRRAWRPRR